MHQYDEFVEILKAKNDAMEARQWLALVGAKYGVIHEMDRQESEDVVEECYRRGAMKVEVLGQLPKDASESSVDMLLITLPPQRLLREELFQLEEVIAEETGFEGSIDEGQQYLLHRWT